MGDPLTIRDAVILILEAVTIADAVITLTTADAVIITMEAMTVADAAITVTIADAVITVTTVDVLIITLLITMALGSVAGKDAAVANAKILLTGAARAEAIVKVIAVANSAQQNTIGCGTVRWQVYRRIWLHPLSLHRLAWW